MKMTMGRALPRWTVAAAAAAAFQLSVPVAPRGQSSVGPLAVAPQGVLALRDWSNEVDRMVRAGDLQVRKAQDDTLLSGRVHERLDQYHNGVRVLGGDVTRQLVGDQTVSLFGVLYRDIDADSTPELSEDEARAAIGRLAGRELAPQKIPELVFLPLEQGGYALTYSAQVWTSEGPVVYFIDADTGEKVAEYNNLQTQAAVRFGKGVLDDSKKVSMRALSGTYVADDQARPPALRTYDMKGNLGRTLAFLDGDVALTASDLAASSAEVWNDGAAVDAQVYQGWTYDYYYKRFGRRGLDDSNIRIIGLVHTVRREDVFSASSEILGLFYVNAFYAGDGVMVYGEGLAPNQSVSGRRWNYLSGALDIVAHELTHGVTDYTSGLIYRNESGALNEAFSDIIATGAEFFFQGVRGRANYLIAEDVVSPSGIRSMADPRAYGHPDHYTLRYRGTSDNGGVHSNSGIANNAFYLAIEGGTNRTSGLSVQGVGASNREQIEKAFYRAFVSMLPSNATFSLARRATIQAAQELYGAGSAAERAITQAWTAVGVS